MNTELKLIIQELFEDESDELKTVHVGYWYDSGKYSYRETIVEYNGVLYGIEECRSGSYFSDYNYEDPDIYEVEEFEEVVVVYKKK